MFLGPYITGGLSNVSGTSSSLSRHSLGTAEANELARGLGNIVGRVMDSFSSTYTSFQKWWNKPTPEQLSMRRQGAIYLSKIDKVFKQLESALANLDKNPNDRSAIQRVAKITTDFPDCFHPQTREDLRQIQAKQVTRLEQRVSRMKPDVIEKVRSLLPMACQNIKPPVSEAKPEEQKIAPRRVKKKNMRKKHAAEQRARKAESSPPSPLKAAEKQESVQPASTKLEPEELIKLEPEEIIEERSIPQNKLATTCPLSFDLSTPNPAKFFKLSSPLSQANVGFTIAGIKDVNNDGKPDFAIADPAAKNSGGNLLAGKVWIVYGSQSVSSVNLSNLQPGEGIIIEGVSSLDQLGYSIVPLGNFNQGGSNGVALGAPNGGGGVSHVYVLFGPLDSPVNLSACNGSKCFEVKETQPSANLGLCLAGGADISGDKIPDLIIGAPGIQKIVGIFGGTGPWPGQFNTSLLTGSNGFIGQGSPTSALGFPLSMGMTQNDPIAGFAVGAVGVSPSGRTNAGTVYVFNGRNGTWPAQLSFALNGTSEGYIAYGQSSESVPAALSIGGDFDHDGKPDVMATTNNKIYDIFHEPAPSEPPLDLGAFNGTNGGIGLQGPQTLSGRWPSIAIIDINGDNLADIAVGMPNYSPNAGLNKAGGILFILGQPGGLPSQLNFTDPNQVIIVEGITANGNLGKGLANLGDVTGNGRPALGVTCGNSGDVYILLSQPFPSICPTTASPTTSPSSTTEPIAPSSQNLGPIIGGAIAGFVIIAAGTTLIVLRVMKKGCFAEEAEPKRGDQGVFEGV